RDEVQRGKAAHDVESTVVEGQADRVGAHVYRPRTAIVADGTLHHRDRIVQPDDEPVTAELVGEETGEIAWAAGHVEDALVAAQMQCVGCLLTLGVDRDPV